MTLLVLILCIVAIIATGWPFIRVYGVAEDPLDALYQSAVIGMLLHGGIALVLATLGIFHIGIHVILIGASVASVGWYGQRRQCTFWPTRTELRQTNISVTLSMIGILLITLWLNHQPSEVIFGTRDAGIYANTGFMIARTGSIVQHDTIVADIAKRRTQDADAAQAWSNLLGVQAAERFMSSRMRLSGLFISESDAENGTYVPQFLHLFPVWIALISAVFGLQYGIIATGLAGLMGVWGVGMAARSMLSPWVGVIAMIILALNAVQVWFSRYPMAETTAQWLFFALLYGMAHITKPQKPDTLLVATIAGAAAGQLMLARLDFVFTLAPICLWIFWRWITQTIDISMRHFLVGFGICGGHGVLHLLTISRGYFLDTFFARLQDTAITALLVFPLLTDRLRQTYLLRPCSPLTAQPCPNESIPDAPWQYGRIGIELVIVVCIIIGLFWIRRHYSHMITWNIPWKKWIIRGSRVAAVVLIGAATYAYFIRPQILSVPVFTQIPTCLTPTQLRTPTEECLILQGYIGAPISPPIYADPISQGFTRTLSTMQGKPYVATPLRNLYANSMANFVRIGWYLSPLGIMLSVIGASIMLWQGINQRNWLFLFVTLGTAFLYIQLSYGTSTQTYIYIMRRYLTNVYPGLAIFIGVCIVYIWHNTWWHKTISSALLGLLVIYLAVTVRPVTSDTELRGAFDAVYHIASLSQKDDITLIRGGSSYYVARDAIDILALPLLSIHGQAVFGIRSPQPEKYGRDLATQFRRWMAEGRDIYLLLGANGALWFPDMHLEKREYLSIVLPEFSQLRDQKPALFGVMTLAYQRYKLVDGPGTLPTTIDTSDTASQVSGFYPSETIKNRTFAWTTGDAVIRFSRPQSAVTLEVRAAAGVRPSTAPPAKLCLYYAGQPYPWSNTEPQWQAGECTLLNSESGTYTFAIPDVPPSDTDTLLVKLTNDEWVPALLDPLQNDGRTLGFQFEGARISP